MHQELEKRGCVHQARYGVMNWLLNWLFIACSLFLSFPLALSPSLFQSRSFPLTLSLELFRLLRLRRAFRPRSFFNSCWLTSFPSTLVVSMPRHGFERPGWFLSNSDSNGDSNSDGDSNNETPQVRWIRSCFILSKHAMSCLVKACVVLCCSMTFT